MESAITASPVPQDTFEWGGFTVASNVSLTRLRARPDTTPTDISFAWRYGRRGRLPRATLARTLEFHDGTRMEMLVGGDDRSFRYQLTGLGVFVIRARHGTVDFWPEADPGPREVEHFLVNAVLGTLAGLRGHVCLHAASAAGPHGATLIAGPSGAGKSTLAWDLIRSGQRLLADDYTVVRPKGTRWIAYPGSATMRLPSVDVADGWDNLGKREFFARASSEAPVSDLVILSPERRGSSIRAATSLVALQTGWSWLRAGQRASVWKRLLSLVEASRLHWRTGAFESSRRTPTASPGQEDAEIALTLGPTSPADKGGSHA